VLDYVEAKFKTATAIFREQIAKNNFTTKELNLFERIKNLTISIV
jgi:hypothetical protein